MGTTLQALLNLQSIERQLRQVKRRLKVRQLAVETQQMRIDQFRSEHDTLNEQAKTKRQRADSTELDLKAKEEEVAKLRSALNIAKTNKEYAAVLTRINSLKADNAKLEEDALKMMQEVDAIKADVAQATEQINAEQVRLEEIRKTNDEEIQRLNGMVDDLSAKQAAAAEAIPPEVLSLFERIAENYDGEAMAVVEVHGRKPPYDYICGGCFMSLNAEHANALRVRDEIRTCDNCGRILYLEKEGKPAR